MKFLGDNFLLQSNIAEELYHAYVKDLPIIDYHNHLPPVDVAGNINFKNLTEAWLYGDHYKWRAMRTNGIDEHYITGNASDEEKFMKWAETIPYTMRNPLYHWTHLELQRYFGIDELLTPSSAARIYENASAQLKADTHSSQNLLKQMKVEVICTTDDPIDSLEHHQAFAKQNASFQMFPAFRPDKAMAIENLTNFNNYLEQLGKVSGISINSFQSYLDALHARHDFFASQGCCVSDHGLSHVYAEEYTESEIVAIFERAIHQKSLSELEVLKFKSAMLVYFAEWDFEKNWVQQYHVGAFRNTNSRMFSKMGADSGWDSIGDFKQGAALCKFLDRLDKKEKLTKTIIYNLNSADNDLFAAMTGNFNDGTVIGKVQYGSAWWFHDQLDGMTKQINSLSNIGLISRFIGMLTDSRSLLSFPRHEYFRRLLCNIFAEDIKQGIIPNDIPFIGQMLADICYHNAKAYFPFKK